MTHGQLVGLGLVTIATFWNPQITERDKPAHGLKRSMQLSIAGLSIFILAFCMYLSADLVPYMMVRKPWVSEWVVLLLFLACQIFRVSAEYVQSEMRLLVRTATAMVDAQIASQQKEVSNDDRR